MLWLHPVNGEAYWSSQPCKGSDPATRRAHKDDFNNTLKPRCKFQVRFPSLLIRINLDKALILSKETPSALSFFDSPF